MVTSVICFVIGLLVGCSSALFFLHPPGAGNSAEWAYWVQAFAAIFGFIGLFAVVYLQRGQQKIDRLKAVSGVREMLMGLALAAHGVLLDVLALDADKVMTEPAANNARATFKRRLISAEDMVAGIDIDDLSRADCVRQALQLKSGIRDCIAHLDYIEFQGGLSLPDGKQIEKFSSSFVKISEEIEELESVGD